MRTAAKAQDALRRDTLRFALSAVHNDEVARRRELTGEETVERDEETGESRVERS